MSEKEYDKPSGGLWINTDKVPGSNQPDHTGNLEFDKDLVKELVEQINQGNKFAKCRLASWNRVSRAGNNYISVSASSLPKPKTTNESDPAPQVQAPPEKPSDETIPF